MNCMNCGAPVTRGAEYCPKCGFHVLSQRKAIYLSKVYYNQGLEKATVRDLSGAIRCLKQSLKLSKLNIQARNLLGLVYFETGEVVAALCEWVISKNIMSRDNLAVVYIQQLQSNPAKLAVINRTVNKYNLSLSYCRQGNEDMAMAQLKKVLAQNPKLIKAYHLLALLQIREEAYAKARKTLKKALKIDKTNTTSLRFLREVDEQTGMTTDLSGKTRKANYENEGNPFMSKVYKAGNDLVILPQTIRESSILGFAFNVLLGILIGGAALWFLVVPARVQQVYDEVNQQIQNGGVVVSQEAAAQVQQQAEATPEVDETEALQAQIDTVNSKSASVEKLMLAYQSMNQGENVTAATYLKDVVKADLSQEAQAIYQTVSDGIGFVTDTVQDVQENDASMDSTSDSDSDSDSDSGYDSGSDSSY